MAVARKCDKCGKYYDENKKYISGAGRVLGLRFETRNNNGTRIDLCDECLGKLKAFLNTDALVERGE